MGVGEILLVLTSIPSREHQMVQNQIRETYLLQARNRHGLVKWVLDQESKGTYLQPSNTKQQTKTKNIQ